jgi:hypothetical protein
MTACNRPATPPIVLPEQIANRAAGWSALAAGACWVAWAVANTITHGEFERSTSPSVARTAALLTAGWNLLLIPAALRIQQSRHRSKKRVDIIFTVAGVLSLSLWAFGGLTRVTPHLETVYVTLAAVWQLGIGPSLRPLHPRLATFTLVVGGFTALDALFTLFEPMPFALYVMAAPKLPLGAAWSVCVGASLLSGKWDDKAVLCGAQRA